MTRSPLEFFRNMPKKRCTECGKEMEEMHESYMNECEHCLRNAVE
ncbi:YhfH family protein [Pueribacillus theae]|uniref:YhfH family protein n=1 Tax=Pueribacillus theae TaxID=2171751 RepID=A0A2U1JTU0_9BACI|nr:protein YhfH [Pueribacillus theae]PWA08395.1 YhfH family protein [Pueribacillus theae]